ncbi:MAG: 3-ketoacyl-ACP reductase [Sphaerochaetaceae bacterium]|nr:3-ketoacyl-ACP reductase [Sphaerochaetaceae bacterium]NLO61389.1 3-ketoacyl-ACP reductase [Spirochaetales bacterium]MDD2405139.1 3-ketoacyl-ACP reductase [Sphaerochaetaceae bacterium]MDD3670269.1 3-ketoacyl-ACP reductase [Sphaerochaetaceae bacterium]MDD4258909.1 3-ketoacyl-ACP reductase [Sphaerochaetaceae bacterium]
MKGSVVVTGGSRGIGRGICIQLAKTGYSVVVNYVNNSDAAMETKRQCEELAIDKNQRFVALKCDISDTSTHNQFVQTVFNEFDSLDALVNNAGIAPRQRDDVIQMSEKSFREVMDVNLVGPFFLTQRFAQEWQKRETSTQKHIVFVSSISSTMVSTNRGEYCISKAGISMAVSLFAARLASEHINVYEVRPGIIKTDMTSTVIDKYNRMIDEGLVPQHRWGYPEDIGKTVQALIDGSMPFSTGSVIDVDGGLHIPRL